MGLVDARDYQIEPYLGPEEPSGDEIIHVDEGLLSEALREGVDPIYRPFNQGRREELKAHGKRTTDVSRKFLRALIEHIGDGLDGCDHAVNICQCEAIALHNELKLALDGKLTCPLCGGEGYRWDEQMYLAKTAAIARKTGEPLAELRADGQDYGNVTCVKCGGAGLVRVEEA